MPTAPVNDNGAVLYYEDSGAPSGVTDYSTVVIVHGLIFHNAIFRPIFPYAARHNVRFVTVNMREYPQSSPLSEAEFAGLISSEASDQAEALKSQALEIGNFISWFIQNENIPPPRVSAEGTLWGGVSLVHWSAGNALLLSLLGNIASLKEEVRTLVGSYLRTAVIYDPPSLIYGIASPEGVYTPYEDPTLSPAEVGQRFVPWVSGFFEPVHDLASITPGLLRERKNMNDVSTDRKYLPTSERMSLEELLSVASPAVLPRVAPILALKREVYQQNLRRALLDTKGWWPNVKVVMLWADMTCMYAPWGARYLSDVRATPVVEGEQRRDVQIVKLPGASHFFHYDEPERMVQILVDNL